MNISAPIFFQKFCRCPDMSYVYKPWRHRKGFWWRHASAVMNNKMTPERFRSIEKLYHYTSIKNAELILLTGKMIMGKLSDMNDINESCRLVYSDLLNKFSVEDLVKEISEYRQLSLTLDAPLPGYSIPAMWAHYADKGFGACIVLDKQKLIEKLSKEFLFGEVKYKKNYDPDIFAGKCNYKTVKALIAKKRKSIFFCKSFDWRYEQEFRIVHKQKAYDFSTIEVSDCIMALIVNRFHDIDPNTESQANSRVYRYLRKILPDVPLLSLGGYFNGYPPALIEIDNPGGGGLQWYPAAINMKN